MIQGILTFKFNLNQNESGEIDPEFKPIQTQFKSEEYTENDYSELIVENDIFATFYQQTTGLFGVKYEFSNFYSGMLKETPYQVVSYFKQLDDGSQYLTLSLFEIDDEIDLFIDLLKEMGSRLDKIFGKLEAAQNKKQLSKITNLNIRLKNELKYTIFQIERLSNLDKLQKVALIYNNDARLKILEILRERPISKMELKQKIEKMRGNLNLDVLLQPFLELNIIRRDWIKGEKDEETGLMQNQGEYLFLIKDILMARIPNKDMLNHLQEKEKESDLYPKYKEKVDEYFATYDPYEQSLDDLKKISSILLNPDVYDFFMLLRTNYYPRDKIPKIFSEFAVTDVLIDDLKYLKIITEIKDKTDRKWIILLTDIKPLIIFPEFLLPKIREFYKEGEKDGKIKLEIAKKAYDLLELTYPEEVKF
ncbi:MAG: hypothetical protein BAJALOKI2v1_110073 [Promethearchaeota archaeon]|nr:MAG: hypothetical protein BAJALOKI2v1_110073 [Candidatus Lokiarchaeota archaeon]